MNTNQRLDRLEILMEHMDGKIDTVIEIVRPMAVRTQRLEEDVADLKTLKPDVKAIKAAVTATNKDLKNHEKRITNLEHLNGVV